VVPIRGEEVGYWLGVMGMFVLQDALASIAFYYPKEPWRWNQTARLIRAFMGVAIIVIGAKL